MTMPPRGPDFAPSEPGRPNHFHTWTEIASKPTTFPARVPDFIPHDPDLLVSGQTTAVAGNLGDFPTGSMTDAAKRGTAYAGRFQAIPRAIQLVVAAAATGTMAWYCTTDFGAATEAYNANSDSLGTDLAPQTTALTANIVTVIDLTSAFTGAAAGDFWGLAFVRDGDDAADTVGDVVHVLGLLVTYQ